MNEYRLRVIYTSHSYKQTLVNYSCAIKNFVKSVKYLEFLAKVYFNVAQCYFTVYVKITSYLYCVLYK